MKTNQKITYIHWDKDEAGYRWPTIRDDSGELLEPFTSFLEALMQREKSSKSGPKSAASTVESATYAVSALAEYLLTTNQKLYRLTDARLEELRRLMLEGIQANPIGRGKNHASKRSTNTKLINIYKFLYWAQKNRRLPSSSIGWSGCRIQSSLPEADSRGSTLDIKAERMYPLCFERVGGSTRRNEGQYWATTEDIEAIEDFFWSKHPPLLAERNTLALRIQEQTAWRNESINSLTIDMFSSRALQRKRMQPFCLLSPPKQKFGYEKEFSVEWTLIDRIVEYISHGRTQLVKEAGASEIDTEGRLFVGIKGKPLTDRTYGEIFSMAFQAIHAPKGSGGHSIRRYRTVEEVKAEISRRRTMGLNLTRELVVRPVMDLLGHNSEEAGRAYDRVTERLRFESYEADLSRRAIKAELEADHLRARLDKVVNALQKTSVKSLPKVVQAILASEMEIRINNS